MRSLFLSAVCGSVMAAGCTGDVSTTPDSVKIEAEVPKIEIKKTPDLDPRTDDDIDVKTPTQTP